MRVVVNLVEGSLIYLFLIVLVPELSSGKRLLAFFLFVAVQVLSEYRTAVWPREVPDARRP